MSNQTSSAYAKNLALYEAVVAAIPGVERKGDTMPYTSRNGHMFSYLTKSGDLALRLPPAEREAFLTKYKTKLCEQYGVVQKEYVMVPTTLLRSTQELRKHFAVSYDYVSALRPKPTKRKSE